jgi:hypothetical protein
MIAIWIELPAADIERARAFYQEALGAGPAEVQDDGRRRIVVFEGTPYVSLNQTADFRPSADGPLPYFDVTDLDAAVQAVVRLGGTIVEEPHPRPGLGRFALIRDSEGNSLYLHSQN